MEQRVSVVTLGVDDLKCARGFYEALGWRSSTPAELEVVFFQAGGMVLALWDREKNAKDSGAVISREPGETFWGGYSGVFVDPDGYPWEIAHNPGWALAEDGSVRLPDLSRGSHYPELRIMAADRQLRQGAGRSGNRNPARATQHSPPRRASGNDSPAAPVSAAG